MLSCFIDFDKIIELLRNKRKLFHSEDDLKFELGYLIKETNTQCQIRLEKPANLEFNTRTGTSEIEIHRAPIDIVVIINSKQIPIELKYKTLSLNRDKSTNSPFFVDNEFLILQIKALLI